MFSAVRTEADGQIVAEGNAFTWGLSEDLHPAIATAQLSICIHHWATLWRDAKMYSAASCSSCRLHLARV